MKVRLEEIEKFEDEEDVKETTTLRVDNLFEKVLGSLNPFSQFIIREIDSGENTSEKVWELDEAIFKGTKGEVKKENLFKTSAEMFVIYKFANDPRMVVKSAKYTGSEFTECKNLLPLEEAILFETSVLNDIKAQEAAQAKKKEEMKLQVDANPFVAVDSTDEMSKILEAIVLAN